MENKKRVIMLFSMLLFSMIIMSFSSGAVAQKVVNMTENSGGELTNYQVKLNVTFDSDMVANFSDVYFSNTAGSTNYSFWLTQKVDSLWAEFYVKIPTLTASTVNQMNMHYGGGQTTSLSNYYDAMIWAEDCATLNTTRWNVRTVTNVGVADGLCNLNHASSSWGDFACENAVCNITMEDQQLFGKVHTGVSSLVYFTINKIEYYCRISNF